MAIYRGINGLSPSWRSPWSWVVLVVGFSAALSAVTVQRKPEAQIVPVSVSPRVIFASGRVEGKSPEIKLHAMISECVHRIHVREGDLVAAGELLIELSDAELAAEQQLAEASLMLEIARRTRLVNGALATEIQQARSLHQARVAEQVGAEQTLQRIKRLGQDGAASAQSIEEAESRLQAAEALMLAADAQLQTLQSPARSDELAEADGRIAIAEARLQAARAAHDKSRIRAPTAGQVLQINVEPGELASPSVLLVVICDTSRLSVRAEVEELDVLNVAIGQVATVTGDSLRDEPIKGRVVRIRPRLNNKRLYSDRAGERLDSRVREVWIDLDPATALVIGLPVDVLISVASSPADPVYQVKR